MNKLDSKTQVTPLRLAIAALFAPVTFMSQAAPLPPVNTGTIIQQTQPALQAPTASDFQIQFDGNALADTPAGGPQALLKTLQVTGASVFTESEVLAGLGDVLNKSYDMAGYRKLANSISQFYRDRGYPFAKAYIPAQSMKDGVLRIDVLEGKYGRARVKAMPNIQAEGQAYVSSIAEGEVIESDKLERIALIMNDIPGYKAIPAVSPGDKTGTANLNVLLVEKQQMTGDVSVDNQGSRYTGYNRVQAGIKQAHMFNFGDEVTLRAMYTDEKMLFGNLGYSLPIAPNGLRANFSYSHTQYSLGREFASLSAIGTADIYNAGLSYPLIRSQLTNINANVSIQHKDLMDFYRASDSKIMKSSNSVPLSLSFDNRDQFLGGGITYGALTHTMGNMTNAQDAGNTVGDFSKSVLDIARIQSLPADFSIFVKGSAQKASRNLDASEDLLLGGANAVRAYPQGEAAGDEGYFAQLEVRYAANAYTPYVFYDAGRINTNASSNSVTPNQTRDLAGAGLGLRYNEDNWSADIFAAWRTEGGKPTSDLQEDPTPRVLGTVTYRFGSTPPAVKASQLTDGLPVAVVAETPLVVASQQSAKVDSVEQILAVREPLAVTGLSATEVKSKKTQTRLVLKGKGFGTATRVEVAFAGKHKTLPTYQFALLNPNEMAFYIHTGKAPTAWKVRAVEDGKATEWVEFTSH